MPRRRDAITQPLRYAFAAFWMWPATVLACPTCKEALFDPTQAQQILKAARGYALSIGVMIGVPMLLVVGFTVLIVRHARRSQSPTKPEE